MPQDKPKRLGGKQKPGMAEDAGPATPKPKRQRTSQGGVNGAQEKSARKREATSEDDSPEATNTIRDMGCAARADVDDAGGDGWRKALEELRMTQKPREPVVQEADAAQPQKERLLAAVRGAAESGQWEKCLAAFPRPAEISAVAKKLDADEVSALIAACAKRYESHPRDRFVCSSWILQALEDASEEATGTKAIRQKLRPLLRSLGQRVGPAGRSGEVLSCLGKWRYLAELGTVRRETMKATKAGTPQRPAAKEAAPQGGQDDSDSEEDDAQEEAQPGDSDSEE